jgi:hypothetical protein
MPKKKTRATIQVPDGTGGMKQLLDRRFEKGAWIDTREVAAPQADTWLQYLSIECERRGLQCAGISQIDTRENSGSYTIRPAGPDPQPELILVWELKRQGSLIVRSRLAGTPLFDETLAKSLLERTTADCKAGVTQRVFCAGYIEYDGLAWQGEHWFEGGIRLGPPPREYNDALTGPRAILVEAEVEGLDIIDARATFRVQLRELAAFMGVALRKGFRVPTSLSRMTWVWTTDAAMQIECDVRHIGYEMPRPRNALPNVGIERGVPTFHVIRPRLGPAGIGATDTEQQIPDDVDELWSRFSHLPSDKRQQFLRVASLWQLSNALLGEFETASMAYLVAACEALKPSDSDQRLNAYDVIETLLGKELADKLRSESQPQKIRHAHFHAGEILGQEFGKFLMMDSFRDPGFRQAFDEMWLVTAACIVEWLRRDGVMSMASARRDGWERLGRRRRPLVLALAGGVGIGWLLHSILN